MGDVRRGVRLLHSGKLRGDGGRSICLSQHMLGSWFRTRAEWESLAGTDLEATKRCAAYTMRALVYHAKRCRIRGAGDVLEGRDDLLRLRHGAELQPDREGCAGAPCERSGGLGGGGGCGGERFYEEGQTPRMCG